MILWKGISVVRLAGFLDHRGLKHLPWMLLWQKASQIL
jgi:hypothetical protein